MKKSPDEKIHTYASTAIVALHWALTGLRALEQHPPEDDECELCRAHRLTSLWLHERGGG